MIDVLFFEAINNRQKNKQNMTQQLVYEIFSTIIKLIL